MCEMNLLGCHEIDPSKHGPCPDTVVLIHIELVDNVVIQSQTVSSLFEVDKLFVSLKNIDPISCGDDDVTRLVCSQVGYMIGGDTVWVFEVVKIGGHLFTWGVVTVQTFARSYP